MAGYPENRLHRLRKTAGIRDLVRETKLSVKNLIFPIFITYGENIKTEIKSMPGNYQISLDNLPGEIREITSWGIPGVLLFGLPRKKDETGSYASSSTGLVQEAVRIAKDTNPDILVITDLCLCGYISHGHCGILDGENVDNDKTLDTYREIALSQASAGSDIIAPSGMMDGQVGTIRKALDTNGYTDTAVMGYSAKFASSFYGPFRDASDSSPSFGDRKSYQIDPANWRMAMREIQADVDEGADIIMIKPSLAYLDVINRARASYNHPIAAYNVSGEFSMVKAGIAAGIVDAQTIILEILTSIKRAGADIIISYHAKEAARWLTEG
ncbi:MAG: porphobilinogen synthase [Dehalococcoidia bacterium]|nr:porphobilinogen synthase [Dehalococcoidia bacterium]